MALMKGEPLVEKSAFLARFVILPTSMAAALIKGVSHPLFQIMAMMGDSHHAQSTVIPWNAPALATGSFSEPALAIRYLHTLKSSEVLLKEPLEKAKEKKEAAFGITFAKPEQEIFESKSTVRDLKAQLKPPSMKKRKLLLDPATYEEFTRLQNLIEEKNKKASEFALEQGRKLRNRIPRNRPCRLSGIVRTALGAQSALSAYFE